MSALHTARLGWYARRAARMSPAEIAWRARDHALQAAWSSRQVTREQVSAHASLPPGERRFTGVVPPHTALICSAHT